MAERPRLLTTEEQDHLWSIEGQVARALRSEQRSKVKYHLRQLRQRVDLLERMVLTRFEAARPAPDAAGPTTDDGVVS